MVGAEETVFTAMMNILDLHVGQRSRSNFGVRLGLSFFRSRLNRRLNGMEVGVC